MPNLDFEKLEEGLTDMEYDMERLHRLVNEEDNSKRNDIQASIYNICEEWETFHNDFKSGEFDED